LRGKESDVHAAKLTAILWQNMKLTTAKRDDHHFVRKGIAKLFFAEDFLTFFLF
jgi:hypothetical protein